jgi:hypothetical protein
VRRTPDPALVPQSLTLDLPAGGRWEEVAVAFLRDGEAYAWGAESQLYPEWKNPAWRLDRGVYRVTVRVEAGGVEASKRLKLDNLAADFVRFQLADDD